MILKQVSDENLPIVDQTKRPTKRVKKVEDGRTQVLAHEKILQIG
jgi:hypothetical protein